jgi:uncharacterized phiE125 gp8 family phage protein
MKVFDVKTTVEPVAWPVTLTEVKTHLHITDTDNDTQLTDLFKQVTKEVEGYCGIAIGSQTKVWLADLCAGAEYPIPYGPVISITSVSNKTDVNEYTALVTQDDYDVDELRTIKVYGGGRVKVTYVTGYTTCPPDLKLGILNEIAYRYENRGDEKKDGFSVEAWGLIIRHKDFSWE